MWDLGKRGDFLIGFQVFGSPWLLARGQLRKFGDVSKEEGGFGVRWRVFCGQPFPRKS